MRYHDPVRIQGYCSSCEKYGVFWSCPPFERDPLDEFPLWTQAVIVCDKVPMSPGLSQDALLEVFLGARLAFAEDLDSVQARHPDCRCLIAGHCSGCPRCTRPTGKSCRCPERLRYSLEALGFDVSGVAEGLAAQKISWNKGASPEYLTLVGAVLCADDTKAQTVLQALR